MYLTFSIHKLLILITCGLWLSGCGSQAFNVDRVPPCQSPKANGFTDYKLIFPMASLDPSSFRYNRTERFSKNSVVPIEHLRGKTASVQCVEDIPNQSNLGVDEIVVLRVADAQGAIYTSLQSFTMFAAETEKVRRETAEAAEEQRWLTLFRAQVGTYFWASAESGGFLDESMQEKHFLLPNLERVQLIDITPLQGYWNKSSYRLTLIRETGQKFYSEVKFQFSSLNPMISWHDHDPVTQHPEWRASDWEKIKARNPAVGMSMTMVRLAVGHPDSVTSSTFSNRTYEMWTYGKTLSNARYYYFHDDILQTIKSRH